MAQTMSVAQLQAEIQSLTAQLTQLETQLAAAGGSTTAWCYTFNNNLSIGMSGNAVTELQTALQKDGESVTVNGTFDDQTAAAVTGFQEKYQSAILSPYGLTNGTGYAGKSTRAELNSLFGCGTVPVQPIGPTPVQPTPVNPSPAMSVYQNNQYGVRFSYPSNYTVKYGNAAFGTSGDYGNQLGDDGIGLENPSLTSLVTIEMPSNSYPDTGFDGAYLNVSVAPQMNSSQCAAMNAAGSSPSSGIKTIGGVLFNWSVDGSAAAGTDFTNGSFSGYTNGTCYVLLAGGVESNGAIGNVGSDGVTITAVNQNSILAALNSVLATMTFSAPSTSSTASPTITLLNPSSGSAGTMVTITGTGFTPTGNTIIFGQYNATTIATSTNGTTIQFQVPLAYGPQPASMTCTVSPTGAEYCPPIIPDGPALGGYPVEVENANGTSNSLAFTVAATATSTTGYFTVINPESGITMNPGSYNITWKSTGAMANVSLVRIDLLQNGTEIGNIGYNQPNNGLFTWMAGGLSGTGYQIAVTPSGNALPVCEILSTQAAPPNCSGSFTIAAPTTTNLPIFSLSPSFGPVGTITTLSSTNSQCGALNQCTYVWLQNGSTVATNAQWTSPNQIQVPASCAQGICDLGIWNPTQTLESEVPFTVTAH
jgi:peptidoglycan hydrolase-like protein with peptidoglycan-binding domain